MNKKERMALIRDILSDAEYCDGLKPIVEAKNQQAKTAGLEAVYAVFKELVNEDAYKMLLNLFRCGYPFREEHRIFNVLNAAARNGKSVVFRVLYETHADMSNMCFSGSGTSLDRSLALSAIEADNHKALLYIINSFKNTHNLYKDIEKTEGNEICRRRGALIAFSLDKSELLYLAVKNSAVNCVKTLLEDKSINVKKGFKSHFDDKWKMNPYDYAIYSTGKNHQPMMNNNYFMEYRAKQTDILKHFAAVCDINKLDNAGKAPLHKFCRTVPLIADVYSLTAGFHYDQYQLGGIILSLLEAGASPVLKDANGKSALELFKANAWRNMAAGQHCLATPLNKTGNKEQTETVYDRTLYELSKYESLCKSETNHCFEFEMEI